MNTSYWIELLFRRRRILLQVATVVFGAAVFVTALCPPTYQSAAQVMVRDDRAQLLIAPNLRGSSARDASIVSNPVSQEELNSEVELLRSRHLITAAIKGLPLPARQDGLTTTMLDAVTSLASLPHRGYATLHGMRELDARDRQVLELRANLSAWAISRSNVIEVAYRSNDARWAQDFLSRLLNQYLEYHARISHDPQAQIFFANQARQLKAKLFASEDQLRQFQLQNGISNLSDQNHEMVKQLSELELQYKKNAVALVSAHQRVASLGSLLGATPERIERESKSVQNLALAQIKPQVLRLETQRAELLTRYQPNSLRMREIDAQLSEAKSILKRENHLEVEERATELNPVWITIDTNLAAAKAAAQTLEAGQQDLTEQIQKTQNQLATMVNNGVEFERLKRQVQTDTDAYLTYVRKAEEARVAQGLNAQGILNVSVSQPPLLPLKPIRPVVWMNLAVGLVLALTLGLLAAYWEEQSDPKLYSAAAIAEVSGLSTLAVLHEQR
jgi:uncharacterized protein involved in exopolysaccharide biosynthesis